MKVIADLCETSLIQTRYCMRCFLMNNGRMNVFKLSGLLLELNMSYVRTFKCDDIKVKIQLSTTCSRYIMIFVTNVFSKLYNLMNWSVFFI